MWKYLCIFAEKLLNVESYEAKNIHRCAYSVGEGNGCRIVSLNPGAGRSGFQVKGFAMRLMHMGKHSYVVGETCTPNIKEDGLLVICSGSGETKSLVNHASKAKEVGAKIALITINPESSIAKMADVVIEISAPSPKSAKEGDIKSIQPMGSLFEQSEGLFMDIAIMMLMERNHMDSDTMFGRHANME